MKKITTTTPKKVEPTTKKGVIEHIPTTNFFIIGLSLYKKIFFEVYNFAIYLDLIGFLFSNWYTKRRAKDLRKCVIIFREGGSTPAPPTLPVIRVQIIIYRIGVFKFKRPTVYSGHWAIFWYIYYMHKPCYYEDVCIFERLMIWSREILDGEEVLIFDLSWSSSFHENGTTLTLIITPPGWQHQRRCRRGHLNGATIAVIEGFLG